MVAVARNPNESGDANLETRLYPLQNWRGDINLDGGVTGADIEAFFAAFEIANTGPSQGAGAYSGVLAGYSGYVRDRFAAGGDLYHVRHRVYDTRMGRWTTRDPLGYVDGMGLYGYAKDSPIRFVDNTGHYAVAIPKEYAEAMAIIIMGVAALSLVMQQQKLCEAGFPPIAVDWSLGLDPGTTVCKPIIRIANEVGEAAGAAASAVIAIPAWLQQAHELVTKGCNVADFPDLRVRRLRDCGLQYANDLARCSRMYKAKYNKCIARRKTNWGWRRRCIEDAENWKRDCDAVSDLRFALRLAGKRLAPRLPRDFPSMPWYPL